MIDKFFANAEGALSDVRDGATVMIGGFGAAGMPVALIDALIAQGARDLTIVNNNAGNGDTGLAALLKARARAQDHLLLPAPGRFAASSTRLYRAGEIELELVPQGNLAERIRAAGAGIGGFFTPTGYGTELAEGKETREIDGRDYVLEYPIHADFALIKADARRPLGQPRLPQDRAQLRPGHGDGRARSRSSQVREIVELGELDPEAIVTPGIFVQRVVRVSRAATGSETSSRRPE